ncbi:MAG: 4Fe-4S dicluster domain-containing protein [Clostridia bacterium]|nr:4Fe-4S dicluster domain-containing protein [Clostridia bacterium]
MKQIALNRLDELFAAISARQTLLIPQQLENGDAEFRPWSAEAKLYTGLKTSRSAKDAFFPQVENLVGFKVSEQGIELMDTRDEVQPFTLFGVRGCDARSFDILDRVFLAEPVDTFYADRRAAATVVTLACNRPETTCFCQSFGIDPSRPAGDVTCWMDAENLYWQPNTDKGRALTEALSLLEEGEEARAKRVEEDIQAVLKRLPLKDLSLDHVGAGKTKALFDRPEWAELSEACLGCGACTFVCPTCQCYDIEEFKSGGSVRRFRCWDSCMYSDFTLMSAGQPRPTQTERFRQRFMHKLVYYPDNQDGLFSCVGCGRCLVKCPIHMNIVKVINALKEGTA